LAGEARLIQGIEESGPLLFGQRRAAPTFNLYSEAPASIRGRTLVEVAEDLAAGRISPDALPIRYFVNEQGQRIAINNRGLAALTMGNQQPTILIQVTPTPAQRARLLESAIDRHHPVPGFRLPITINRDGTGHIYTVILPGN
jgi:hypothetical protein